MVANLLPEAYNLRMDHGNMSISDYRGILLFKSRHQFHIATNKIRKLKVLKQTETHYLENPRKIE